MRNTCGVLLAVLFLASSPSAFAEEPIDSARFHIRVATLYSFEPHTLSDDEMQAKSATLDAFWRDVKNAPSAYLPLLRHELKAAGNSNFFAYDGSKLLLSLSTTEEDERLALAEIAKADLRDVQHTDYLLTVHWFAVHGFDVTRAALRILDYPDFKAFIAAHVLTLGQDYSFLCMLAPMDESQYLDAVARRLETEKDPVAQKSLLLVLWYSVSPKGKDAIAKFAANNSLPQDIRDYAIALQRRKVSRSEVQISATAAKLKQQRREAMHNISDEALTEYDQLTAEIIAQQ
jgi:hypothetical protein